MVMPLQGWQPLRAPRCHNTCGTSEARSDAGGVWHRVGARSRPGVGPTPWPYKRKSILAIYGARSRGKGH
eukprot:7261522-Alexandrium_andersonii.AAC.1